MARVALVTGGSSGLGFEIASELYAQGFDIVLLARDGDKLETAKRLMQGRHGAGNDAVIHTRCCDVSDDAQLRLVMHELRESFARIDYLVLSAGMTTVDLLEEHRSLAEVQEPIHVNLLGAMAVCYLARCMLGAHSRVLFVSSGFGLVGAAGYAPYCASKGGLNAFADALRRELARDHIHVHVVCPGDIDTPMYRREIEIMPTWMRGDSARAKPMSPQVAARRVLRACAKNRYMITISADVKLLLWVRKLLPRAIADKVIDKVLPSPPPRALSSDEPQDLSSTVLD